MKTRWLALLPGAMVLIPWLAACQSVSPSPSGHGGAASGGPGSGDGSGGGRGSDQGGSGEGGDPAGTPCAGGGAACSPTEYCEFPEGRQCGIGDAIGVCQTRPEVCVLDCPGVCGCDGQTYCNDCMARAAGTDVVTEPGWCAQRRDCQELASSISDEVARAGMCTSVVLLDHRTLQPKSVRLLCAPAARVTPVGARAAAERDTGFGVGTQQLGGLAPDDEYVFWKPPSDHGGVAAVSARSGLTVFGGSIEWSAVGHIVYPVSFRPADILGPGCGSAAPKPPARGLDLRTIDALADQDIEAVLAAVWRTALPDGIARQTRLLDAMVLLYPPRADGLDRNLAQWVVLLNSGPR